MKTTKSFLVPLMMGLAMLASCSSSERHVDSLAVNASASDNPAEEIAKLEASIEEARKQGVDALAPTWFASAQTSLNSAKEARDNGKNFSEIFKQTAEGQAQLAKAKQFAGASESNMPEVLQARKAAWDAYHSAAAAGATNTKGLLEDFATAESDFKDLTKAVENDNLSQVGNNRQDVINQYRKLHARSLDKGKLDTARRIANQAKDEQARRYAPQSLAFAEQQIKSTEKFIENSPTALEEIDEKSDEALFYANRALQLTRESKSFASKKPEEVALWIEQNITALGKDLGTDDVRNQRLEQQFAALKDSARRLKQTEATVGRSTADNRRLSTELQSSQAKARQMTEQSEKVKSIAASFQSSEADVLQKDGKVIIRLRGTKFPVGGSRLGSENFALLAKVSDALKMYPGAHVMIEGHTDSTGGEELNLRLSQARAEAVKNFLISSKALAPEQVTAVGYGFKMPLASNKTKETRAMNRRIDIVISSSDAPLSAE